MWIRISLCGVTLLLLNIFSTFIPSGMAKSKDSTVTGVESVLQTFPMWSYIIIAVVLIVFLFFIFQIMNKNKLQKIAAKMQQPITIRHSIIEVIPGNAQHIGTRSEQQDAFGFSDLSDHLFINKYGVLAVLADGMGGLVGGKEVSHLAVHTFLNSYLHSSEVCSIPERLVLSLERANHAVLQYANENGLVGGVGTTLLASVIYKNQLYWLSVGDSRIYLNEGEQLTQLTTDHIYANELDQKAALGMITTEEAINDPQRESLTSYLGLKDLVEIDVAMEPKNLQKGDSVILCSDGLYGSITNKEILAACSLPTQEMAEKMMECALQKQKPNQDNVTIAILTIK